MEPLYVGLVLMIIGGSLSGWSLYAVLDFSDKNVRPPSALEIMSSIFGFAIAFVGIWISTL